MMRGGGLESPSLKEENQFCFYSPDFESLWVTCGDVMRRQGKGLSFLMYVVPSGCQLPGYGFTQKGGKVRPQLLRAQSKSGDTGAKTEAYQKGLPEPTNSA